ncbi:MAG TPA: response regulator [Opitutaceae bacterium]|nr:response regulator [Opitutaceae bacterium]
MLVLAPPVPSLAAALGENGWLEPMAPIVGLFAIGLLAWQLWRSQRGYALELAEQSRQVAEEHEKTGQAWQAMEAVTRESQAKSEMLATLSREIRAHLNGIIGSADLMLDNPLSAGQREHLVTLRSSAESLHRSLNDVLDYSTIETGQIQIAHAPFDLREPLIEVVEALAPLALLKGLELVLIVSPDVPLQVTGDPARLRQILLNLMSNAVKFTASGRVVLRAGLPEGSAGVSKQGGTWLHFSVTDTGVPIPAEAQATIFDRTVGGSDTSPTRRSGSGLELAISKRLVELMGGQIGARNLPEGGSEFWVVLALPADKSPLSTAVPALDGLHVVVLDDLAASRVAVSAMLGRLGVDQDATDNVTKAGVLLRDAFEEGSRELVLLLDESAIEANRAELMKLLAPDSTLRPLRLVLMSRNPDELSASRHGLPATAILRKPVLRADALLEALRSTTLVGDAPSPTSPAAATEASGETKPLFRRGPHVLVVDDDAISRSVSAQRLGRLGCAVEVAESGAEAIAFAQRTQFELIFMDCQMPEMDGFTTTEKIRGLPGRKAPPIVALTANISDRDREKCFAAGMCDFVGKPVNKADLARVLKRWIQTEGAPAKA